MKVIVGVDDSSCSNEAIAYVARAIWPAGVKFIVVSAVSALIAGPNEFVSPDLIEGILAEQEKHQREVAERAAGRLREAGLAVEARAVRGDPRAALEDEALREKADLLVVGSHGRSGIRKLLLGSVATHVVTHAPCSVLVVKTPA